MSEVRSSIQNCSSKTPNIIKKNTQDFYVLIVSCNSSIDIDFNVNDTFNNLEEDKLSSSSSCVSDFSDVSSFSFSNSSESFCERLASCFVSNNITHLQGNSILSVLRTHPYFSYLSKDIRTLLNTAEFCYYIQRRTRKIHSL